MSVLQPWVEKLTFMQQSVLITCTRGPDTLEKNHVAKMLLRWFRRCYLYCAFDHKLYTDPYEIGGGSFTGPCIGRLDNATRKYFQQVDMIPLHFHLHLMHASEILGYKHPDEKTKNWFHSFYRAIVKDMHLNIETEEQMDYRLSDEESRWKENEDNPAK